MPQWPVQKCRFGTSLYNKNTQGKNIHINNIQKRKTTFFEGNDENHATVLCSRQGADFFKGLSDFRARQLLT